MKQGDYSLSARKGLPGFYSVCYKKRATGYTVRKETTATGAHMFVVRRADPATLNGASSSLILALYIAVKWLEAERVKPCEPCSEKVTASETLA